MLPFLGWWLTGLFDLDEGYYGAVTAEMLRRHEWITPYYNGHPWFEKPILLYWVAKPSLALFGNMVGPRLPSVLASQGTMGLVYRFAKRHIGVGVAELSVAILASSIFFVAVGRLMLTDPLLVLAFTGALTAFWTCAATESRSKVELGVWLGLGVLAKGPVAILLFVPIAVITYGRFPDFRSRIFRCWIVATPVTLAVIATWYLPAYFQNGQTFVQKFLIEQNVQRFTGGDAAHTAGPISLLMYPIVLGLGMCPWTVSAVREGWNSMCRDPDVLTFLWICALVVFGFFMVSSAKLPHYVLPCVPPLAILAAARLQTRKHVLTGAIIGATAVSIGLNLIQWWWYSASGQAEAHRIVKSIPPGEKVALYRLSRQSLSLQTGTTRLQETGLPSLLLYLDRIAIDTDDFDVVLGQSPVICFTRSGRVGEKERNQARLANVELLPTTSQGSVDFVTYDLFAPHRP